MTKFDLTKTGNKIILAAGVVTALIMFGGVLGVDWPLTENSPVITGIQEFAEDRDMEQMINRRDIDDHRRDQLLDYVDQNTMILSQFEGRNDLTDMERRIKTSLENDVEEYLRELNELARKRSN